MTQEKNSSNTDKCSGLGSAKELEEAFSELLEDPSRFFEFQEEEGLVVARQKAYIPNEKWLGLFKLTTEELGGEVAKEGEDWLFKVAKKPTEPVEIETTQIVKHWEPERPSLSIYRSFETVKPGYYPNFPIDRILSSKFSFRINIDEGIEELAAEIHAAGMIIEPLVCRPADKPGYVEVGPGERRLYAAKQMLLREVPIIIKEMDDAEFDRIRLIENLARKDLSDMEIAKILDYMLEKYKEEYPTQVAIANAFGKSHQWVGYHLRMLDLEKLWTEKLSNVTRVTFQEIAKRITERQAREILSAPPEKQIEVAKRIVEQVKAEGKIPSAREIRSIVHPEEEKPIPTVPCELCGKAVTEPIHVKGKYYCEECAVEVLHPEPSKREGEPETGEFEAEEESEPKVPSEPKFDLDKDIAEGLVSENVKWILQNWTGDINYRTTLPLLTDEELEYCLQHETRKTGLRLLQMEKNRRAKREETMPSFYGTGFKAKHCPLCNHTITEQRYRRLKHDYIAFKDERLYKRLFPDITSEEGSP